MTLVLSPSQIFEKREAQGRLGELDYNRNWETKPLGELIELLNGAPFDSNRFNRDGKGMPLIRIRDVGQPNTETWFSGEYEDKYVVSAGDVLVGLDGDFRVANWHGPNALLNQRVCKLIAKSEVLDSRFMVFRLNAWLQAIWEETSATTVKHLSSKSIQQIPFPLPPLDEQRRIVATLEDHLSRLDKAHEEVERASKNEVVLKLSLIHSAFSELEANVMPLGQVSQPKYGKDVPKHLRSDSLEVPVVGSAGVMTYTSNALVQKPCVLVGRKGNVGAVQKFDVPCSPVDTAYYLVCPEDVDLDFMYYQLLGSNLKSLDSSTAIPSLRREDLESVAFKKPSMDEQRKVASQIRARLGEMDSAVAQLSAISSNIRMLRRAVLAAAFNGKLVS